MTPLEGLDEHRLARLIDAGRGLLSELDLETVLDRLLQTAADLTGARYVALGVLDEGRRELARFLTRGIDEDTHRAIGDLPRGRGLLGVLIDDPRPLRLDDVGDHPRSYGFPPGHPPMRSFLGVPILIRGEAWGNLYLTEKAGGEPFAPEDEEAVVVLADWAAIAIENAGSIATWPPAARSSSVPCAAFRPPRRSPARSAARPSSSGSSSSWSSAGER